MNVACQIRDTETGKNLPRVIFDADMHHDAERAYCDKFGIDQRDVGMDQNPFRRYYWIESQETHEDWDESA